MFSRESRAWPVLPGQGLLVATIRWGSTTLASLDLRSGALVALVTRPSGEMDITGAPDQVAYLAREGVDPCRNYLEILNFREGCIYRVKPENGFAILGFSFGSRPTELIFTEMNLRESRSRHAHWRTVLADIGAGDGRVVISSDSRKTMAEAIPVPLGWSAETGEAYFQGLLPFRGMIDSGLWAMSFNGQSPKEILAETAYVGRPRLSSDGDFLAYLSSNPQSLPVSDITAPGAPPGNVLVVTDLRTGRNISVAEEPDAAFGCLRWSATSNEILVVRRHWLNGRFRDRGFLAGAKESAFQLRTTGFSPSPDSTVTDIARCENSSLFWVEKGAWGTRLRGAGADSEPATLLTLDDGDIRVLGCIKSGVLKQATGWEAAGL
ncbi:MAG: hypothetical protein WCA22_11040 [Candidatus Binatus sp.]